MPGFCYHDFFYTFIILGGVTTIIGNFVNTNKIGKLGYAFKKFVPFSIYVLFFIAIYWSYNRDVFLECPNLFVAYVTFATCKPAVIIHNLI